MNNVLVPQLPKIYHIVHVDRLPSIADDGFLWCDAEINRRGCAGSTIGMNSIKVRRLRNSLNSYSDLHVGDCVPFYFCPRSVMLYLIHKANHRELSYRGGQAPILHFEADLHATVAWAQSQEKRWAFTLSNAGSSYFEDRNDLAHLGEIDWTAVQSRDWQQCREAKQAEFLLEFSFPFHLIELIGVQNQEICQKVKMTLQRKNHGPAIEIRPEWYYSEETP